MVHEILPLRVLLFRGLQEESDRRQRGGSACNGRKKVDANRGFGGMDIGCGLAIP